MKNIKLTSKELIALREVLFNHNACNSGCVYEEMEHSKKGCDECEFVSSIESILNKISD